MTKLLSSSHAHHTQIGVQGGERIVGHLGARGRHRADEGGLARVGHAEQADVGQHLQFQLQFAAFAFFAGRALARRAVGAGLEMQVAQSASAAFGQHDLFAVVSEVGNDLAAVDVGDDSTDRHMQDDIVGALAIAVRAAPGFSVLARCMRAKR